MSGSRKSPLAVFALCAVCLLGACGGGREPVRIGSQAFTEQKILAEMMALLAEDAGVPVIRAIPYGDNRRSLAAIQVGEIDAYPEYDGSLFALIGLPATATRGITPEKTRKLVEPLGLRWMQPFGFENDFVLAVRRDFALQRDVRTISDLASLPEGVSVAADSGFRARPVDGLYALARRYGFEITDASVFPVDDRMAAYEALASRAVDVATVFRTDPWLGGYGILALEDDLGFFPVYQPAPLVRADVLEAYPQLADAWSGLAGKIDIERMQLLNARVDGGGEDYRNVARQALEELGLLPAQPTQEEPKGELTLAVTPLSDLGYLPIRAAAALREVMPARRLTVRAVAVPAEAVRSGEARFGLVGAEDFFRVDETGRLERVTDIEAVGMVGNRLLHVIARPDNVDPAGWERLAVGPEGSGSWNIAKIVIETLGLEDKIELISTADFNAQREALDDGDADALVVIAERGHAGIMRLLGDLEHRLVDTGVLEGDSPVLRYPFLRPVVIPAGVYPGQSEPIDTLATQAVLASRVPPDDDGLGESGPGFVPGVFTRLPQRLPFDTAARIRDALRSTEAVDPTLPASPGLYPETPPVRPRISVRPGVVAMNVLAVAFLTAMVMLYLTALPKNPALTMSSAVDDD
jgi:osmoprotectant transport system permease protein